MCNKHHNLWYGAHEVSVCLPDAPISKYVFALYYSSTVSNDSSFYFIKIIVLISWICTQIKIRMGICSIIYRARGPMRGQICLLYATVLKLKKTTKQQLYSVIICSEPASINPDSNKNEDRLHHISWYGAQEGSICLPYLTIQISLCIFDC